MGWRKGCVILGLCLAWLLPAAMAQAQSRGVLSTPLNVATIARTNAGTEGQVAAQGSGIRIRLLGFFVTSQTLAQVQFLDSSGTACTGVLTIATGGTLSVPVSPPGYVCETGANTRLDMRVTTSGLSVNQTIGGSLQWQASQ